VTGWSDKIVGVTMRLVYLLPIVLTIAHASDGGYVGREVCAGCHKSIAVNQAGTNMARTWQDPAKQRRPANYSETHTEGPAPAIEYELKGTGPALQFQVKMTGQPAVEFPIETMVGGQRHGISFLFRVPSLQGLPLPVSRLLEARYFHYAEQNKLAFSLGFPVEKPTSYETAMGRVLTPYLEVRCLGCHGAPRTLATGVETGVTCEHCHGPGQRHLTALGAHAQDLAMWNPTKLPMAERMRPCTQCHAGSSIIEDPMPDDVLISDQVTALKNSECYRQSGGDITCINCHDPHQDAPRAVLEARADKTCLRCHSAMVKNHAGLCPVNRTTGCAGCHMLDETRGAFVIAEHWIRVNPEAKITPAPHNPAWRTTITPKHLFLRMTVVDDRGKASEIRQQLAAGGSFFDLARSNSMERDTASKGGYLGDLEAGQLEPAWSAAALKLLPGEISDVVEASGKFFILQRMPRNFRVEAEALFNKAMELQKQGKHQDAVNGLLESLKVYPHFLRALTWLGATYGSSGNPAVGVKILTIATRLYPKDGGAHFNLGMAYGAMGNPDEISEYKRTIEIDPDYVLAYLNWGAALYGKGQYEEAIKVYQKGLEINPLLASLHYSLGLALEQVKKTADAEAEMALAKTIDPNVGKH